MSELLNKNVIHLYDQTSPTQAGDEPGTIFTICRRSIPHERVISNLYGKERDASGSNQWKARVTCTDCRVKCGLTYPADDQPVYLCDPEYCDDGYHVDEPISFMAWHINRGPSFFDEYGSGNNEWTVFPADEAEVVCKKAFKMKCGTWFRSMPELLTKKQAEKRLREPGW